jgi:hypothetical protein
VEERVKDLTVMIEDDTKKVNDVLSKLREIQDTEKMNSFGIMHGSVLSVTVMEARDLKTSKGLGGLCNPYVVLSIGEE